MYIQGDKMKHNKMQKTGKLLKSEIKPKVRDIKNGSVVKYAKVFNNGGAQAVRIPAEYKFDSSVKEVIIEKTNDCIIIQAVQPSYDNLIKAVNNFSDDFMSERVQPKLETRDLF